MTLDIDNPDDRDVLEWLDPDLGSMDGGRAWWKHPDGVTAVIGYRRRCPCGAYRRPHTTEDSPNDVTLFGQDEPARTMFKPTHYRQNCADCGAAWRLPQAPHIEIRQRMYFLTLTDGRFYVSQSGDTAALTAHPDPRAFADHLWQGLENKLDELQKTGQP